MPNAIRVLVRRSRSRALVLGVIGCVVTTAVAACSSNQPQSNGSSTSSTRGSTVGSDEPLADRAMRLAAPNPWLAAAIAPNVLGWTPDSGRFISPGWRAANEHDNDGVGAAWPNAADAPIAVGVGQDSTRTVTLTPIGAAHSAGALERGRILFHDAYDATDVVVGATRERVEELLVLRSAAAPSSFAWTVGLASRLTGAELDASGALAFYDERGKPRLLIPQPYALDAAGTRRNAVLSFDGTTLSIALDTTGLAFPVALDPTVVTPVWTKLSPAGPPPTTTNASMTFDSNAGVAVLFGGISSGSQVNATYLWNGGTASWSTSCGNGVCAPPARNGGAMAFDPGAGRNVSVLFGGYNGTTNLCDTYEFGSGWTAKSTGACPTAAPSTVPAKRQGATMSDDGASGVLLFGGFGSYTGAAALLQDTWTWSGSAWTQQCTASPCSTTLPPPRRQAAMVYDAGRGKVVLFGGVEAAGVKNDTWEWSGTAWAQVCTTTPCTTSVPAARSDAVMVYDSNRKRTVLTGGWDGGTTFFAGTWEWDGSTWTALTAETATSPGQHIDGVAAYDSLRKEAVLFGGSTGAGLPLQDTWVFQTYGDACASASDCDTAQCVDATCCTTACGSCQVCNGTTPGVCAAVTETQTARCTGANYCNASGSCVSQLAAGQSCANNVDCGAGLVCAPEGVCCNSACSSDSCHSCLAALTGAAAGSCSPITAGTAARASLPTPCTAGSASSCGLDGTCNGSGACRDWPATTVCSNESCTGAVQTNAANCNGAGACNAPTTTACGTGFTCGATACNASCTPGSDAGCQSGYYCVGGTSCAPKLTNGTICSAGDQCSTGNCNHDGVCCDQACNGVCQSCTNAKKGSGPDGTCGGTAASTADPSGTCTNSGTTCGAQPLCDGTNSGTASCVQHAHAGTVCGATTCTANAQSGQQCDGAGNCASANNVACAPYDCADGTMCATTCAMDSDCQTGGYCSGAHTCIAQQTNGQMCGSAHECTSGLCVDGFCCNGACGEQCQACNVMGKEGTCSPVTGAPVGTRPACTNAGMAPCGGACNGTNGAACTFAGSTTTCGNACSGAGNTEETTSSCNGQGACVAGEPAACPNNLLCDTTTKLCKTTCTSNADCAPNYDCDPASHLCAAMTGAVCDGMHTINSPMEEPQDCTPYICSAMGCLTKCASPTDCVAPNICDESDHCNLPQSTNDTSSGGSSGGCAMATATPEETRGASYVCALLGVVAIAARRRRKPASPR